jgi:hypothetical protein
MQTLTRLHVTKFEVGIDFEPQRGCWKGQMGTNGVYSFGVG